MLRCFHLVAALGVCVCLLMGSCSRHPRVAEDITPGNLPEKELDWRYGANDIRIQTTKLTKILVDRWLAKMKPREGEVKPRVIITEVTNLTDSYIPLDIIRDIIESVAINDGRFSVVVGNPQDTKELDELLSRLTSDPKYSSSSRLRSSQALAPQALAKIRLTMAVTHMPKYDIQDWRMSITLYDIETQEAIDSAYDVLRKKVYR